MKAVDGFEPTIKLLQSRALPLGYGALTTFSIIVYVNELVNITFKKKYIWTPTKKEFVV